MYENKISSGPINRLLPNDKESANIREFLKTKNSERARLMTATASGIN
jgi:hypothetical protein